MHLRELVIYTNSLLNVDKFKDYCPNGLQVEGRSEVRRVVGGVTASLELLERALEKKADAIIVHHGYFWRSEASVITGVKRTRLRQLLRNDISLLAYHLPLDAHVELGNNVQLGQVLGIVNPAPMVNDNAIWIGWLPAVMRAPELVAHIASRLGREPLHIAAHEREISRVAWCTGAAQDYFERVADAGVDAYITGEVSEQTYHQAIESAVDFFSAGHHATERYGMQALGKHLAQRFEIDFEFVDCFNPV